MAIYVFSLLAGYMLGGMDYAQGTRSKYLKKISQPVKYIYTNIPTEDSIRKYKQAGIEPEDTISAHFFLAGNGLIEKDCIIEKTFYIKDRLIAREYYSNRLLYTDYFSLVDENNKKFNRLIKRTIKKPDGASAYDIIWDENGKERYIFPNGKAMSKQEFLCEFVKQLALTEKDIIVIDRGGHDEFAQPLFEYGNRAKLIVFLHACHYAEKGEASGFLYFNYEYYYWFKYSHMLHTVIVSTELQKEELISKLREHDCYIPNVEVIPICGVSDLCKPDSKRKQNSLMTASRLTEWKKIDWIIRSVIKAHEINPNVSIDIYGQGDVKYTSGLEELIKKNNAQTYIHLKGHCDLNEVYKQYEAYISASIGETYGLTVLDAIASGNAMIGLNVKYGNKIFIQNEVNGYLVDLDCQMLAKKEYVDNLVDRLAECIVKLFSQEKRLAEFQEQSYVIASKFMENEIEQKWISFIEQFL